MVLVDHAAEYLPALHRRVERHDYRFVMIGWPLVQLPPSLLRDDARLGYFLGVVPGWMPVAVDPRNAQAGQVRLASAPDPLPYRGEPVIPGSR